MPKINKQMLHNYKPYQLFKMYNKYEKSFVFSKEQKLKFYYWIYRYTNQGKLIYHKIDSDKLYDIYIILLQKRENKMVIKRDNFLVEFN